jgi:hypothetical protein
MKLGARRFVRFASARPTEGNQLALLIQPTGALTTVRDIHKLWYNGVRDLLGGPAEIVELDDGRALIVNEEYELRRLPVNIGATSLLQETLSEQRRGISSLLATEISADKKVLGPALLLDASELERIKDQR